MAKREKTRITTPLHSRAGVLCSSKGLERLKLGALETCVPWYWAKTMGRTDWLRASDSWGQDYDVEDNKNLSYRPETKTMFFYKSVHKTSFLSRSFTTSVNSLAIYVWWSLGSWIAISLQVGCARTQGIPWSHARKSFFFFIWLFFLDFRIFRKTH